MLARFFADYAMLAVLSALGALLSAATIAEQHPSGAAAATQLAGILEAQTPADACVAIIARAGQDDRIFADTLTERLTASGRTVVLRVNGQPSDGAQALQRAVGKIDAIAVTKEVGDWAIFDDFERRYPACAGAQLVRPRSYYWPNFLKTSNLLNIANQIAVIAIMAIGMTMVIIAGGIDLSVGSLLALSAVLSTWLICKRLPAGRDAGRRGHDRLQRLGDRRLRAHRPGDGAPGVSATALGPNCFSRRPTSSLARPVAAFVGSGARASGTDVAGMSDPFKKKT